MQKYARAVSLIISLWLTPSSRHIRHRECGAAIPAVAVSFLCSVRLRVLGIVVASCPVLPCMVIGRSHHRSCASHTLPHLPPASFPWVDPPSPPPRSRASGFCSSAAEPSSRTMRMRGASFLPCECFFARGFRHFQNQGSLYTSLGQPSLSISAQKPATADTAAAQTRNPRWRRRHPSGT